MKVGIVGASGYSGEVLVKLLLGHPRVTLAAVTSRTHAGKPLVLCSPAVGVMSTLAAPARKIDGPLVVCAIASSDIASVRLITTTAQRPVMPSLPSGSG